jgi:catechol 2,3-dioxygenase-like lactoylglutathione lyase family enzyme
MKLRHVALVYSSQERADQFLGGVLGMQKAPPKTLSAEMARAIFDHDGELRVINYSAGDLIFEVFIDSSRPGEAHPLAHVLLEVENLAEFLDRCRRAQAVIRTIPRRDSVLVFVADADHHLFEVKERPAGA